ncbi:MAG TPA: hypothetical protein VH988_33240 [Thermoanaerobaculia bacterium]|jgi:hypothetical protein|nr:hypothetical protein [Thermoanaerobaculia bacterium]
MKTTASWTILLLPAACLLAGCGTLSYYGLQAQGVAADAEVLDHWEAGFNEHLVIGLKVRVEPAGQAPFETIIKRTEISPLDIEQFEVGALIPVHFDPQEPSQVRVDTSLGSGAAPAAGGATGVAAQAQILEHWSSGPRIKRELRVGLRLRVRPADRPPFEEVLKTAISPLDIPRIRRGAVISVHFDPKNPSHLTTDLELDLPLNPEPSVASAVPTWKHDEVPQGVAAQAEILEHWENTRRTNEDPEGYFIGLSVRVHPADRPAYEATIERTGISPLDIPRFQPGLVIPVRFDPKDPSRVTVDRAPSRGPQQVGRRLAT